MIAQRRIALAMVLLQLALYAILSETLFFSVVLGIAALIGFTQRLNFSLSQSRVVIYGLLLGGLFYSRWYLSPISTMAINVYFMNLGYSLAQYFLTLQVILLFLKRKEGLYTAYPLLGIATFTVMGDLLPSTIQNMLYHAAALFFVALSAYFFSATRQRQFLAQPHKARSLAPALLLVVVLGLSAITNTLLFRYQHELDAAFANLMYPTPPELGSGTRLSQQVRLGSVAQQKGDGGMKVALRIYAEETPEYMRGRAFDEYRGSNWFTKGANFDIYPLDPDAAPDRLFPLLGRTNAEQLAPQEIWPDKSLVDVLFTGLHTSYVAARSETLQVNSHRIVSGNGMRRSTPYTLYHDFEPSTDNAPQGELLEQLLAVSSDLNPEIRALANTLFEGADTPEKKVARTVGYFTDNYLYNLGFQVPPGEDPLSYFLLEQPPAHCEYFASGTAVLLRLGGIPTRYVTGYVAREKNPVGGYWVARSRDAHAWVEAYVDGMGWIIVESTPAAGVPQGDSASNTSYAWDDMKHRMNQIKEALLSGIISRSIRSVFTSIKDFIVALATSPAGFIVLLPVAALIGWRWYIRRRVQQELAAEDPDVELHTLLKTVDDSLAERGVTRDLAETLHGFAHRVEEENQPQDSLYQAGDWYRDYATARYSRVVSEAEWETLQRNAEPLIQSKSD